MRIWLVALAIVALGGCSTSGPQVSVAKYDATPRAPTKRVEYFEDESQLRGRTYTAIAVVSVPGEGADVASGTVAKVLGQALDEARKLGGEAIILIRNAPQSAPVSPQTLYKVIVFGPAAK
jgi:hypothetical protein